MEKTLSTWFVYMIRTRIGTLYTGVTTDVERRFKEHSEAGKKGARYLKGKGPLTLVWQSQARDKRHAMQLEYRIKQLPKTSKHDLVQARISLQNVFPELFPIS